MNSSAWPPKVARNTFAFLQELLADYWPRTFAIRLWNGSTWEAERGMPTRFTLVVNNPAALRAFLREPRELSLAEAYLRKDLDIEGDIRSVFDFADYLIDRKKSLAERMRLGARLLRLPAERDGRPSGGGVNLKGASHSRERDRQAVSYHYDVSNDFYALWLDRSMVYSCACFRNPEEDLDSAQQRKLDYICRKLQLRPGDRLLDIGCGWGGLLMHAARTYGVKTVGITLSRAQAELARERVRSAGLQRNCAVDVCDYRDIREPEGFDKLVSVGMFEHVGEKKLTAYFGKAWSLLKPGGLFLNHGIASNLLWPVRPGPSFTDKYVFPDGELVPLSVTLKAAEAAGFEVRDVESLREHYALTLDNWVRRLEEHAGEAIRLAGERSWRIWKLSMAASAHGFTTGRLNVYQTLLLKPNNGRSNLSLTRPGADSTPRS